MKKLYEIEASHLLWKIHPVPGTSHLLVEQRRAEDGAFQLGLLHAATGQEAPVEYQVPSQASSQVVHADASHTVVQGFSTQPLPSPSGVWVLATATGQLLLQQAGAAYHSLVPGGIVLQQGAQPSTHALPRVPSLPGPGLQWQPAEEHPPGSSQHAALCQALDASTQHGVLLACVGTGLLAAHALRTGHWQLASLGQGTALPLHTSTQPLPHAHLMACESLVLLVLGQAVVVFAAT